MAANQELEIFHRGIDLEAKNADFSGTVAMDVIAEKTSGAGVTIDGMLIKDGAIGAVQEITGDGAITIQNGTVLLSKGSAGAITIAAPAAADNGKRIQIVATTAQAHVITCTGEGFNGKGSTGTLTLGGARGDGATLLAYNQHWYVVNRVNATPA